MKRVLNLGLDMVIYPEGTRNRSYEPLKKFYDGAFRLAADTKKPIIPTLVFNSKKVLPATKVFFMLPHTLEMHFLPAVERKLHGAGAEKKVLRRCGITIKRMNKIYLHRI